ncbi:MAG: hypothetical protein A2Y04_02195, partial [Omnitrophica WOR_2 bacterium GWC2_45_7]
MLAKLKIWQAEYDQKLNKKISLKDLLEKEEYFELLNEEGQLTGQVKPRGLVHYDGDWHRDVRVLVINSKGEVLLQKRAVSKDIEPGLFAESVGGHTKIGETYDQNVHREIAEEIGVKLIDNKRLVNLGVFKDEIFGAKHAINRSHYAVYEYRMNAEEEALIVVDHADGIQTTFWVPLAELRARIMAHPEQYTKSLVTAFRDENFFMKSYPFRTDNTRPLPGIPMPSPEVVAKEMAKHDVNKFFILNDPRYELLIAEAVSTREMIVSPAPKLAAKLLRGLNETAMAAKLEWMVEAGLIRAGPVEGFLATTTLIKGRIAIVLSNKYLQFNTTVEQSLSLVHEIGVVPTETCQQGFTHEINKAREELIKDLMAVEIKAISDFEHYLNQEKLERVKPFILKRFIGACIEEREILTQFITDKSIVYKLADSWRPSNDDGFDFPKEYIDYDASLDSIKVVIDFWERNSGYGGSRQQRRCWCFLRDYFLSMRELGLAFDVSCQLLILLEKAGVFILKEKKSSDSDFSNIEIIQINGALFHVVEIRTIARSSLSKDELECIGSMADYNNICKLYWHEWYGMIERKINLSTVFYPGAGADISSVFMATDADFYYFVDESYLGIE